MPICGMFGCRSRSKSSAQSTNSEPGIGLHCLPKVITWQCERTKQLSEKRRSLWLTRINRKDLGNLNNVRVCGRHFIKGKPSSLMDDANPDWAPTQHLGYERGEQPLGEISARYQRSKKRQKKAVQSETSTPPCQSLQDRASPLDSSMDPEPDRGSPPPSCSVDSAASNREAAMQTDLTEEGLRAFDMDNRRLASELRTLAKQKQQLEVTEASLREDDAKVLFYTGLGSFSVLFAVFQFVESVVKHTAQNGLEKFQEFLVFLMKLKWNFPVQDLAYRFGVSDSTVSRIFEKWLHAAFWRLKSQIVWPSRRDIQSTMPQAFFDSFGQKVAVIIDCFEIKIERPSSLLPRSETWSQYKNSNTGKFLIGISPQGVITYISEGWGGRTSDKHITENCGLLDLLSQGDVVLADRGFDIADTLSLYCAKLHVPAFTKGKKQLSALEIESTRKLANVRIHVERVIGLVRNKYIIMKAVQPIDFVTCRPGDPFTPLDKIVTVCCALTNLCPSVVPENPKIST
ncbi:unnamed protein product [Ixodes persulcatus]